MLPLKFWRAAFAGVLLFRPSLGNIFGKVAFPSDTNPIFMIKVKPKAFFL
jgi:hypothetical protein